MNNSVQNIIEMCNWGSSKLLIFSNNVFAPLIYYSHLSVIFVALFFGLFIFLNNKKNLLNRLLLFLTICLSIWMFSDLVLWASNSPKQIMFFWTLEIILEPLIYIIGLYFIYVFINQTDISLKTKIILFILYLPTLILAPTKFSINGFDLTNCDRAVIENVVPIYGYIIQIIIIIWIIFFSFEKYGKTKEYIKKNQILFTTTGLCLFLFSFSLGNIAEVLSGNWYIGQIGYIGIPIFIAFLSYQIVRFNTFNIKIIGTEVFVSSIWFLIATILFIRRIENVRIVVAITLALYTILAILLTRSVKREVKQREINEELAKKLEDQNERLESTNEKLEELDKMKSEFLSLATHQIRAPLTAIKGYSSMILEGDYGKLPKTAEKPVNVIYQSCENLINIVNDFLNISRIEQGRMVYEKSIFSLADVVKEVVDELKPNTDKAGLTLDLKWKNDFDTKINADIGKIKQVITNIIDNAIKYTKKGGIDISLRTENDFVLIDIKDTGIGIDPQEIYKLFNKFSRTKDANKTNVIGTGLGLYIAKKMVEAQGGDILVNSPGLNKGTTFSIKMPLV